jgi:probable F420-dependent oxidoreductase
MSTIFGTGVGFNFQRRLEEKTVKFGITHANLGRFVDPTHAIELATAAEKSGFDSLWTVEHVVLPTVYEPLYPETADGRFPFDPSIEIADPFVWMSYVSQATQRLLLGTAVLVMPQRHPLITAKEAATLDRLTKGRLLLGLGAGWLREEFDALGANFENRGASLTESVHVMRKLWRGEPVSHQGALTVFDQVISQPTPHHSTVPIHIGGFTVPAAIRAGQVGDGFFPGGYNERELLTKLVLRARAEAEKAGRDPSALEITARWTKVYEELADTSAIEFFEELGVDRIVVPAWVFDRGDLSEELARIGETIIRPFAAS